MMVRDLEAVERELGFAYETGPGEHYQQICPRCRRALFGLAQAAAWSERLTARASRGERVHSGDPSR
jgi:hypothetical protein